MSPKKLQFELLDSQRQEVFNKLRPFRKEATLAGGTALCLQIAHRFSFDFDLFFERELTSKDLRKLKKLVKLKEVGLETSEQINAITIENISMNLVYYPYRPLFKKIQTFSLPLFSVKDIALDKAFTIGRRAMWRDYVDLFFILKNKIFTLKNLIKYAEKKFKLNFNPRLFLEQLVYFKDVEILKISYVNEKFSEKEIKKFLIEEVKKIKKNL
ncbi:nucleotidyl transferase AbiEii/AbiGii toxin family protein [bacterium]|nr:nucleotidyl transferase AbiEii/AbiGii toxin family protein [bacterium]